MRLNIAPKLFIGFLVVIFSNVFFFVIVSKLDDLNSIASILKRQNDVKNGLLRLRSLHNVQGLSAYSYERIGKEESVGNFHQINRNIHELLDTLSTQLDTIHQIDATLAQKSRFGFILPANGTLPEILRNIRVYNNVYNTMFDSLVQTRDVSTPEAARKLTILKSVLDDTDRKLASGIEDAQTMISDDSNNHIREVQTRITNVKQVTLMILSGMTLFALIFAFFFSRAITNSMRRLKESASTIGKGDFDFNPAGYPNDEIGELASAFYDMAVDLKNTQDELVRSKRLAAIGEVVASVNHEINNPLMIISGNAQFLEMSMEGYPDEMKDRVKAILEETERISMVTRKLREIKNPVVEDYTSSGEQMINLDKSGS